MSTALPGSIKTTDGRTLYLFSWLALGAKMKYGNESENVWVKISNDRLGGCIAAWDDENQATHWLGQSICSLNDNGEDIYVELVDE